MKYLAIPLIIVLIGVACVACNGDDDGTKAQETQGPTTPVEDVVITIGNITDRTGPAASAFQYMDMALEDTIRYYNENNLIPGVELKLVAYDTQYDTSKIIVGYNYIMGKGADIITSFLPITPEILNPNVNKDEMVLFTANANTEFLEPPGYVFAWCTIWEEYSYTLLKWIAENHWDYEANGPAKIGGAGWNDASVILMFSAAKEYAEAHPDQFEWTEGYITEFKFSWDPEVEALKDCDYIFLPTLMHMFTSDYIKAGYDKATFLANESQTAFLGIMTQSGRWDEIDGTLFIMVGPNWGQGLEELIPISNELLTSYHPNDAEEIKEAGGRSYAACIYFDEMLQMIKKMAEEIGPQNINSKTIYNAVQTWQKGIEEVPDFGNFSPTKRIGFNYLLVLEADAEAETLLTASDWLPVVHEP